MFDEIHYSTIAVIITMFSKFFPEKCDNEQISEIIEYMETSMDDNDVKKQNMYSMISEFMYDADGQQLIYDMIDVIDMPECPPISEIKDIISIMLVTSETADYGENEFVENEFVVNGVDELLREIKEVIEHNNPAIVAEPKYKDVMKACVREHFEALIEEGIVDEDEFEEMIERAVDDYYIANPRECVSGITRQSPDLQAKIAGLRETVQPDQRTAEWYEQRHGLITASSAWKVLDSPSNFNSFVHSKCLPYQPYASTNVDSPLHWGQRYEPVSVEVYEHTYKTTVGEFGCITHPVHKFLGASPDGINVDPKSPLYGRMLEIKNIVNREITGIPKKEYWIQMQLQMEVCDLEDCDFLECVFKEYANEAEFVSDAGEAFNKTASGSFKGVMAMFYNGSTPIYEYCPIKTDTSYDCEAWMEEVIKKNSTKLFVKYIYWRLELMSCVYVPRNRAWFSANVGQLRHAWETIQREKVSGFEHRKPVKKVVAGKKQASGPTINITTLDDEEEDTTTKTIKITMLDD